MNIRIFKSIISLCLFVMLAGIAANAQSVELRAKIPFDFNRYRENGGEVSRFLSQVWVEGMNRGYEFLKSRVEREAALRAARRDIITIVVTRVNSRAE